MTAKRSAFHVFRSREKSQLTSTSDPDESDYSFVSVKRNSDSQLEVERVNSSPSSLDNSSKQKIKTKSSIRKSLRRKNKKEAHHEIALKHTGKENKLEKVGSYIQSLDRPNWTESLQSLNSSVLEEEFLPGIVKQKKEQQELHKQSTLSLLPYSPKQPTNDAVGKKRRRSGSLPTLMNFSQKPPIPKKKVAKSPTLSSKFSSNGSTTPEHSSAEKNKKLDDKKDFVEEELGLLANAEKLFAWLIGPVKQEQFFRDVWQKKPLLIKRKQPKYNNIWLSTKEFDTILRQQVVQYTKNLDVAIFRNGLRETLNPNGRAFAPQVWKFYEEGCSLRLLNPATFSSNIWHLSSKLQEYFGCLVGSNMYLTPPGSQGFAPHYDDIEAFVIQLEGRKRWRLYPSRNLDEVLPRHSSENMSPEELGEPILDRVLEPGDALYFPRGVIHQAVTPDDSHSLHITLSVFQKCCWSDFMEKLVPMALQSAIEEDVEFRRALPVGFHNNVGMSNSEKTSELRKSFLKTARELMKKLVSYVSIDEAADELVLDQMEEFLPPSLISGESQCTIFGSGAYWNNGHVHGIAEITLDTKLRIIRPGVTRLIPTGEMLQIHTTVQNSREYKQLSLDMFEVPLKFADAVEYFLFSYPDYVRVKDAPIDDDEIKLNIASQFYKRGIICTESPLT